MGFTETRGLVEGASFCAGGGMDLDTSDRAAGKNRQGVQGRDA